MPPSLPFILAACLAFLSTIDAQAGVISLRSAVDRALSANPALQASRERVSETSWGISQARASIFPEVTAYASAYKRKDSVANRTSVPFGGEAYNSYNANIRAEQPLLKWGIFSAIRYAGYAEDLAANEASIAERDLARRVILAYFKVVFDQKRLDILLQQDKVIAESLKVAQAQLGGAGKRTDYLQVKTQAALQKTKISSARVDLASSAAELATLLGLNEGTELPLHSALPDLSTSVISKSVSFPDASLLEMRRIQLQRDQLGEQRAVVFGDDLPSLSVIGVYDFTNYKKNELFDGASKSWSAQLLLTVPLFSGLSSVYERRALNSREAQLELSERDTRLALDLAQVKARKALEASEASLESAKEAAELSEESLRVGGRDYRLGVIDFLNYLRVQEANFTATTSLLQLRYDNIAAYANYFVASGQNISRLVDLLSSADSSPRKESKK